MVGIQGRVGLSRKGSVQFSSWLGEVGGTLDFNECSKEKQYIFRSKGILACVRKADIISYNASKVAEMDSPVVLIQMEGNVRSTDSKSIEKIVGCKNTLFRLMANLRLLLA